MLGIKTILYPTDFSKRSEYAFQLAISFARDYSARLIVLHVAEPLMYMAHSRLERALQDPESSRRELETRLYRYKAVDPAVIVEHCLIEDEPVRGILKVAIDRCCDLIVMGSHGRSGVGRLVLGSIAERVTCRAPCPVVTVKGPPSAESHLEEVPAWRGAKVSAAT